MPLRPVIDYTDKDYASLRRAMLDLARYRLPEWTDQSSNDFGVLLVDLFAYMGDVVLYYQDRIANESFLYTATERRSVLHLLRLVGYELGGPTAAAADLTLTFDAPAPGDPTTVLVPSGAAFSGIAANEETVPFEYLGPDLTIDLDPAAGQVALTPDGQRYYAGLPVRHSRRIVDEILGSSTGEPNLPFVLAQQPLIEGTLEVWVREGANWLQWERRTSLLYHLDPDGRVIESGPDDRAFYVQRDETGAAWVVFGDGVYGRRPPIGANNIRATYRVGGGRIGNIAAGAIDTDETGLDLLALVTNPLPAAGGAEAETTEHGVRFGPLAFRSGLRAVTLGDYVALAQAAGGVAKVRARSLGPHRVELIVAPEGDTCRPVPDDLRQRLIAYFEDKRMAGTVVYIRDSVCVPVDVSLDVVADHHHDTETVRLAVEATVRGLLAFGRVEFGQTLYLSKIYEAVEALDGVHAATVTRFRRADDPSDDLQRLLDELGVATVDDLPEIVRQTLQVEVPAGGHLTLSDFEIPSLGALVVTVKDATLA